jgi:hypothetical protein
MVISIQPVETEGTFWVHLALDGQPMERRGPFHDPGEAEAMAARLAAICRALHAKVTMAVPRRRRSRHG